MKQSHPVNCLICKSEKYKVVFSYTKPDEYERTAGVSGKGYFRKWVRCGQCGFYYSIYSRDPKAMDGMYGSDAYREEGQSWRKEGSAEEVFRKIPDYFPVEVQFKQRHPRRNLLSQDYFSKLFPVGPGFFQAYHRNILPHQSGKLPVQS